MHHFTKQGQLEYLGRELLIMQDILSKLSEQQGLLASEQACLRGVVRSLRSVQANVDHRAQGAARQATNVVDFKALSAGDR